MIQEEAAIPLTSPCQYPFRSYHRIQQPLPLPTATLKPKSLLQEGDVVLLIIRVSRRLRRHPIVPLRLRPFSTAVFPLAQHLLEQLHHEEGVQHDGGADEHHEVVDASEPGRDLEANRGLPQREEALCVERTELVSPTHLGVHASQRIPQHRDRDAPMVTGHLGNREIHGWAGQLVDANGPRLFGVVSCCMPLR